MLKGTVVMNNTDKIINEIDELITESNKFTDIKNDEDKLRNVYLYYESWYTRTQRVIKIIIPERLEDFCSAYKLKSRKQLTQETYTIKDFLSGTSLIQSDNKTLFFIRFHSQCSILQAAKDVAKSKIHDIQSLISIDILDSELEQAKELLHKGYLSSAGVICGVILESHLKGLLSNYEIKTKRKKLSISDLNNLLKDNAYDIPTWRLIQRLSDIRNLCAHKNDREPTKDEVEDLIRGTDKVIKEIL